MIYWFVFFCSCLLLRLSDQYKKNKKKLFVFLSLMFPLLLAGFRAETIGIDVRVYVRPLFLCADGSQSLANFFANKALNSYIREVEPGYAILTYCIVKLGFGLWAVLLISSALCVIPIYLSIKNYNLIIQNANNVGNKTTITRNATNKKHLVIPAWLGMLCFYGFFFNNTLNQIRQSITVCLVMWAFTILIQKKYVKAAIIIIFAWSIHASAVFILPIYLVYYFIQKENRLALYVIATFMIAFGFFGNSIFKVLVSRFGGILSFLNSKYLVQSNAYINTNYNNNDVNLSWVILGSIMILVSIILYRRDKKDKIYLFFLFVSTAFICMIPFSARYDTFGRLAWFFMCWSIMIIPSSRNRMTSKIKNGKTVSNMMVVCIAFLFWIVVFGLRDFTGTIPYDFMW